MVDAVQVFDPGFRVTDANGEPVNNAKIKFRAAGPGATKTVYSDKELSVALGHTIRTRADGYPVVSEGSSTTCLIFLGSDAYHIEITDEDDVAIFPAKDNVRGALSTADFLDTDDLSTFIIPVLSKTSHFTILESQRGTLFVGNAGGGFFTFTLPSAVTVGDDWNVGIRNDGSTNQVGISAAHAIATPMGALTAFSLRPGETVWLVSNGATWKISGYTPPLQGTTGLILIADRLSAPPAATAGARYIVTTTPTGAWSGFAEHDIAEADGQGGWFKFTPPADCGWVAFVQDEDKYYCFKGSAWGQLGGSALQVFSSSDTYTPTAGMTSCLVIATGGGGGGGGADSDGTSTAGAGGGGAGGTGIRLLTASQVGASQTVTIGAAGAAGADTGGNGGNGGNTTFGALLTGNGGGGGTGIAGTAFDGAAGGTGGGAADGALHANGGDGAPGVGTASNETAIAGQGGASFWGGGGKAAFADAAAANAGGAANAYGSGGGGAANVNTAAGAVGGVGKAGVVVVLEFFG